VITPDGTETPGPPPRRRRPAVLVGVAALIVFTGLVLIGTLSSPNPAAVEETTTTTTTVEDVEAPIDTENFTLSQIATGDPLDWELSMAIDDDHPVGLLDHEGAIYLFATDGLDLQMFNGSGLRAWRSSDGVSWDPLGQVIPAEHQITGVFSTGQGLVALEPGEIGEGFTVWRSNDGATWTSEAVASDVGDADHLFYPQTAGGTEETLVVAGNPHGQAFDLVTRKLEERFPDVDPDIYHMTWQIQEDTIEVSLRVFAGLLLADVDLAELDLEDEERRLVEAMVRNETRESTLWTMTDTGWHQSEIPEFDLIQRIASTPGEDVIASGFGSQGAAAWTSRDGVHWETIEEPFPPPLQVDHWGETMVSTTYLGGEAAVITYSPEGDWANMGLDDYFPTHVQWNMGALGAGPNAVAAVVNGWGGRRPADPPAEPPTITRGGASLTLDFQMNQYVVELGGSTHEWRMGEETPAGIETDLDAGTVLFHDPDSGDFLASFDIDEIHRAFVSYHSEETQGPDHSAVVLTTDGDDWTIQDLAPLGVGTAFRFLELSATHVVAVRVADDSLRLSTPESGFEVWSAEIP